MSHNGVYANKSKSDPVRYTREQALQIREGLLLQVDALEKMLGIDPLTSELRRCYYFNKLQWGPDIIDFRKHKGKKRAA